MKRWRKEEEVEGGGREVEGGAPRTIAGTWGRGWLNSVKEELIPNYFYIVMTRLITMIAVPKKLAYLGLELFTYKVVI